MRFVAVAAVVLLSSAPAAPPALGQAEKAAADTCPSGPDGRITLIFALDKNKKCAVVEPVPEVCVDRGHKIRWTLVNKDCPLDEKQTAVELSQPRPKGNEKKFEYMDCTPKKNGWKERHNESFVCKVPADAEKGRYKYDVGGPQVEKLDPDIEVRKGN